MRSAYVLGATSLIAATLCLPAAASAKITKVVAAIEANRGWQKVHMTIHGRGLLHFRAHGQWVFNPRQPPVDGDGAQNLSTAGRSSYTFDGAQGREGQLIGKIGRQKPFVAGARGMHTVGRREIGPLYLMINDDFRQNLGAGLADNTGHLDVTVKLDRDPKRHRMP